MAKKHSVPKKRSSPAKGPSAALRFRVNEFAQHPKGQLWYFGIALLTLGPLLAAFYYRDYLMVAVILAATVALIRLSMLRPSSREVELTEQGLKWGSDFYAFHQLKAFWLTEQGGQTVVYIERPALQMAIHFPVPQAKLQSFVAILGRHLPRHFRGEPISERFARLLRL